MLINNAAVFNTLLGSGAPSIAWTSYDPQIDWARTELESLNPGTLLIQVDPNCEHDREGVTLWLKRSRTPGNGSLDYIAIGTQGFQGTTDPVNSDPDLCAAPIGSIYAKTDPTYCVSQIYIKINNTCSDAAVCSDWQPLLLTVTRTGNDFSYNAGAFTLNVPVGGVLTSPSAGRFLWTPDDGGDTFYANIPTLTDNGDGTYTWSFNDGGTTSDITITATVPTIPADISAVSRPWVKVGSAVATNATPVLATDNIWHTGNMVRGAASIGTTNANAELQGNNAMGAGNHDMTGASNSSVLGGDSNEVQSTSKSSVVAGTNNNINGSGAPTTNVNMAILCGVDNRLDDAPDSAILSGGSNVLEDVASSVICGGVANTVNVSATRSFLGSGQNNKVRGAEAAVLCGRYNEADGNVSTALGMKSKVSHSYAFVINTLPGTDINADTDPFNSVSISEFAVRCDNIRLLTNLAGTTGMTMAAGASAWVAVSDERTKHHIIPLQLDEILNAYAKLQPVSYVQGDDAIGAGVVAQNFYESFYWLQPKKIGEMYAINQSERDGVQDMAIIKLIEEMNRLKSRVTYLEDKLRQYDGD